MVIDKNIGSYHVIWLQDDLVDWVVVVELDEAEPALLVGALFNHLLKKITSMAAQKN